MYGKHPYHPYVARKTAKGKTTFRYFKTRPKAQKSCDKFLERCRQKLGTKKGYSCKCRVQKRPTW